MSNIHPCPFCKSDDVAVFGRLWGGEDPSVMWIAEYELEAALDNPKSEG